MQTVDFNEYSFVKTMPDTNLRFRKLEGYLYPDTYEFYLEENEAHAIRRFLDNFQEKFTSKYEARAKELGMTVDEIVTIASIIQKEAANKDQMKDISSVLHNRLADKMQLQCDSTGNYVEKIYQAERFRGGISGVSQQLPYARVPRSAGRADLQPRRGCNRAALNPSNTSYLYFCHDKNGKIYLAKTYEKHNKNVVAAMGVS